MLKRLIFLAALAASGAHAHAQALDIPRTADGHPDFQGVWAARWITTLERPSGIATLVVTPEQGAAIVAGILTRRGHPGELDPEIAEPDNDGLARVRGELRTSMIIEPADGKLPFTQAGKRARHPASTIPKSG